MSIFSGIFNQSKPGKGIDKNASQKHRFLLFFELYFRKFFKLLELNIVYFIITFPLFAAITFFAFNAFNVSTDIVTGDLLLSLSAAFLSQLPPILVWILIIISAVLFGPLTAGMTYVLRNFAREEHSWIFSDLYERTKSNFKQGLIIGVIDILLIVSFILYLTMEITDPSMASYLQIVRYIAIIAFVVYQIMRFYIYTIIVTFELPLLAIIKNSWLFAVLGFVRNICSIIFAGGVLVLTTMYFNILFLPFITYSLCGFIIVFNSYPTIKKYMLDPLTERDEDSDIEIEYEDDDIEPVFEDDVTVRNREREEQ